MTIQLPDDLEHSVQAAIQSGRFGSADELVAAAVRSLLDQPIVRASERFADPFLGSMRDAAEELDAIVADAYRKRGEETWREIGVE